MAARSAIGTEVPTTSPHPLPAPPRWHLRTQVSRKTLFDLIQDTLPPAGLQVTSGSDGVAIPRDANAPGFAGPGVLPQSYLDSVAATVPISLNPASLWTDGDTTPDIPEHWRPITITLASTPAPQPPALLPPLPVPRHPLHGIAKTGGWMLAGAALTFLLSAASFGGRPMLRAIRAVMVPQTQTGPDSTIPAMQTAPATLPVPARAPATRPSHQVPAGGSVVALAERPDAKVPPAAPAPIDDRAIPAARLDGDTTLDSDRGTASDRKNGAASSHAAHRPRQERRPAKSTTLTEAGHADSSLPGGDDAVMPLESATSETAVARTPAKPTVMIARRTAIAKAPPAIAKAPPAIAKTGITGAFRPIDVEDPFGGP